MSDTPLIIPEPITLDTLTTGELNGTGALDVLIKTMTKHLDNEFSKNRLKGVEYSQVYLGSLTAVMAQATQYVLQKDNAYTQAILAAKQVELLAVEKEKVILEKEILEFQKTKAQKELELMDAQILKMGHEVELVKNQAGLVLQQTSSEEAQTKNITTGTLGKQQAILTTQKTNLGKEGAKIDKEALLIGANTANATKQGAVLDEQKDKVTAETKLLHAKVATEDSQISDYVRADGEETFRHKVTGVVGKQKALYNEQAEGLKKNALQQAAKLHIEGMAVVATNIDAFPGASSPDVFDEQNVDAVFKKLRDTLEVAPIVPTSVK